MYLCIYVCMLIIDSSEGVGIDVPALEIFYHLVGCVQMQNHGMGMGMGIPGIKEGLIDWLGKQGTVRSQDPIPLPDFGVELPQQGMPAPCCSG